MILPRNNKDLEKIFINASTPKSEEFSGTYYVDMLTILPSLRKFSHRKTFKQVGDNVSGHNIVFKSGVWGHFILKQGVCPMKKPVETLIINYNRKENNFISKKIIDYVKCINPRQLYLGRFNIVCGGKVIFLGYFSLEKKSD